jgi:hypothetical protein
MTLDEKRNIEYEGSMELIEEFCDSKEYTPSPVSPYQKWLERRLIQCRKELKELTDSFQKLSQISADNSDGLDKARDKITELYKHKISNTDLLDKYSRFLSERGYLDDDWWIEDPKAIDEFIKELEGKKG